MVWDLSRLFESCLDIHWCFQNCVCIFLDGFKIVPIFLECFKTVWIVPDDYEFSDDLKNGLIFFLWIKIFWMVSKPPWDFAMIQNLPDSITTIFEDYVMVSIFNTVEESWPRIEHVTFQENVFCAASRIFFAHLKFLHKKFWVLCLCSVQWLYMLMLMLVLIFF